MLYIMELLYLKKKKLIKLIIKNINKLIVRNNYHHLSNSKN